MTVQFLSRRTADDVEWAGIRQTRLGGSEVATVLGLPGTYDTPFSLWHRKAGLEMPDQGDDNPSTEWGKRQEPIIIAKWLEEHPGWYRVPFTENTMWVDAEQPWRLASPDALVWCPATGEMELLEVKTADSSMGWQWEGPVPPLRYVCQVRWYLDILGLRRGRLLVLIGGNDYREKIIEANTADATYMTNAGRRFLDTVDAGTPPPVDGSERTLNLIRFMHPDIEPGSVEIDTGLAFEFVDAAAELKVAEERFDLAKAQVSDLMGNTKVAEWEGHRLGYRMARNPAMRCVCAEGCHLCDFTGIIKTPGSPFLMKDARTVEAHLAGELFTQPEGIPA